MPSPASSHDEQAALMLRALKQSLGRRRYRIALMRFGRGLNISEISRREGIHRFAVRRHLKVIGGLRTRFLEEAATFRPLPQHLMN
jgi:DNA-binding transcriptional ArsR family regulator